MTSEHVFLNDIISDHRERMLNLKKYYPFFKLAEISFSQFKEAGCELLDMGYITMAILRFFIEENNFKEKEITYGEYVEFMTNCLKRDFGLNLLPQDNKAVIDYIFDKIKNDGKPFTFEYFDPLDKKKRVSRMKLIESKIVDNTVWYSISSDAIEFYLDTKEVKDESKISVEQLLLEKMIKSKNFKGGTEVVKRINSEVNKMQYRKNEVVAILSNDVFAGIEAYEDFVDSGMRWFEDEQKLFVKNMELIEAALNKTEFEDTNSESYYRTVKEIYELETELKVAINKHSELLRACTDLQILTDQIIKRNKLSRLRTGFNFNNSLNDIIKHDDAQVLVDLLNPMMSLNIKKNFNLISIDDILTYRPQKPETVERIKAVKQENIVFEDELEDERIKANYHFFMKHLLQYISKHKEFTLAEFNDYLMKRYSEDIFRNGDYYSFFIHLCQKTFYRLKDIKEQELRETFLEEILKDNTEYMDIAFSIVMGEEDANTIKLCDLFEITNITFVRED